jgi:hypothetical protein
MSTAVITLTPQFVLGRPPQQLCYTQIYNYLPPRAPLPLFTIRATPFPRRQLSSFGRDWTLLPSLFPAATLGLVPPVRYLFLRRPFHHEVRTLVIGIVLIPFMQRRFQA